MKSPKSILFLFLFISMISISCGDDFGDVPDCISDQIKELKKNACEQGASVELYEFQGEDAYWLNPGFCIIDGTSSVLDSDCNVLGLLGGFAGFNEINGELFFENATLIRVVWEN